MTVRPGGVGTHDGQAPRSGSLADIVELVRPDDDAAVTEEPRRTGPRPALRWVVRPRRARAVVLVLHGGSERSTSAARWWDPAVLRMVPFALESAARGRGRVAVAQLRFGVRGWNEGVEDPVRDARWALRRIRAHYPDLPIGIIGHSMGGRTLLHLTGSRNVAAAVFLAPWVPEEDLPRVRANRGLQVLLLHGRLDVVVRPDHSELAAQRYRELGAQVTHLELPYGQHSMMVGAKHWHRRTARFLREALRPRG